MIGLKAKLAMLLVPEREEMRDVRLNRTELSNSDDNPRMFSVGEFGIRQILEG